MLFQINKIIQNRVEHDLNQIYFVYKIKFNHQCITYITFTEYKYLIYIINCTRIFLVRHLFRIFILFSYIFNFVCEFMSHKSLIFGVH